MKRETYLVLGGAGFVGGHLVQMLLDFGVGNVVVYDDYSRGHTCVGGADYYEVDCADYYELTREMSLLRPQVVFNLAADVTGLYYNIDHHLEMYIRNTMLQLIPFLVAEEMGVAGYLNVSSVCANPEAGMLYEDTVMTETPNKAQEGYGEAKRTGIRAMKWSKIPRMVTVIPTNIAGPGDYYDERSHVIPVLVRRAVKDATIEVKGNPNFSREFVHVKDAAQAMFVALTRGKTKEMYNIAAPRNRITIGKLAERIRDLCAPGKELVFTGGEGGDQFRQVDGSKLRELGWEAQLTLDQIIMETRDEYVRRP